MKLSGRIVGSTIELDSSVPMLEGQRVVVTVETEPSVDEDPVVRAFREAPVDDRPTTNEERAAIEQGKRGPFMTTEELRNRLAGARNSSSG